jgi:hypothetical protein
MANRKHHKFLEQGVEVWNRWREENPDLQPDLTNADLRGKIFNAFDFSDASFREANLSAAYLREANLNQADLSQADLRGVKLWAADLKGANLSGALLYDAVLGYTILENVNLNGAEGLEYVKHRAPSSIDINGIRRSEGQIPTTFLQGCGLKDWEIETAKLYRPNLTWKEIERIIGSIQQLRSAKRVQYHSCFISYSSKDEEFTERLHADLQKNGVRCWFAPEDMKIGDKIRPTLDQSIRTHDKLLLILSEDSINSSWVEAEVETAFEREAPPGNPLVLFPIRIDDAFKESQQAWAAHIRRTRHVGDFSQWQSPEAYQRALKRLLRALQMEGNNGQ